MEHLWHDLEKLRAHARGMGKTVAAQELAAIFRDAELTLSDTARSVLLSAITDGRFDSGAMRPIPRSVLSALPGLLGERKSGTVCDPCAGFGLLLRATADAVPSSLLVAVELNADSMAVGKSVIPEATWVNASGADWLLDTPDSFDIVVCDPPWGIKPSNKLTTDRDEATLMLPRELGQRIIVAAASRLTPDGIGLFLVPQGYLFRQARLPEYLAEAGARMTGALALPPGAYAPLTGVQAYVIIVQRNGPDDLFVGQLTGDPSADCHLVQNLNDRAIGSTFELGRIVDPHAFSGLEEARVMDSLEHLAKRSGATIRPLGDLAAAFGRGRSDSSALPEASAVYIPIVGTSDVVRSRTEMTVQPQNYARVDIDLDSSLPEFIALFLNSELGKDTRRAYQSGGLTPRLNLATLKQLPLVVPSLENQEAVLAAQTQLSRIGNVLLGLQNEVADLGRELAMRPRAHAEVQQRARALELRLSGGLTTGVEQALDAWGESLPFPLASILRAWQGELADDAKAKYEHLLHFFEASAEFTAVVLLSAYSARDTLFAKTFAELQHALGQAHHTLSRADFGAWRICQDFLSSRIRGYLRGGQEASAMAGDMFSDPTRLLPESLSAIQLSDIHRRANTYRNDWRGHAGVVSQDLARNRNEQLVTLLQEYRSCTGDLWRDILLVHSVGCRPHDDFFENDVAVLMGSNSSFLTSRLPLSMALSVDRLYLVHASHPRALRLLPFMLVGPSPDSANNACYFYSRTDQHGLRYISFHYQDIPERSYSREEMRELEPLIAVE